MSNQRPDDDSQPSTSNIHKFHYSANDLFHDLPVPLGDNQFQLSKVGFYSSICISNIINDQMLLKVSDLHLLPSSEVQAALHFLNNTSNWSYFLFIV